MIRAFIVFAVIAFAGWSGVCLAAQSSSAASNLPPIGTSVVLSFRGSVQAQGNTTTSEGTVTITRTSTTGIAITIAPQGGEQETVHIILNPDGSYQLAPETVEAMSLNHEDPQTKAAAQAMFARLALAARMASAVKKSQGTGPIDLSYNLTPVGIGTPIPSTLHMVPGEADTGGVVYAGQVQGTTTTVLPQPSTSSSKSKKMKTTGFALVVGLAIAPVAGLAVNLGSRIKMKNMKKALAGPLPDSMQLVVTGHFTPGASAQISGTQYDTVTVSGQNQSIVTTWSFATQ
jgi:hypothetical protein